MDKKKTELKEVGQDATLKEHVSSESQNLYLPSTLKSDELESKQANPPSELFPKVNHEKAVNAGKLEQTNTQVKSFFNQQRVISLMQNKKAVTALVFAVLQILLLIQLQNPKTYMYLGNAWSAGSNAEQCFKEALFLQPANAEAAAQLAKLAFYRNDYPVAQKYAQQSLHISSTATPYNVLGDISLIKKDYAKACTYIEASLKLNSSDPFEMAKLGWTKKQLGDKKGASKLYENATKLKSDIAIDFHHFGYGALEGVGAQRENPELAVIFEDMAIDLHVEKIDPLREWYAHMNKARAYLPLFEPTKARAEDLFVLAHCKDKETISTVYENLIAADELAADYSALKSDAKAQAKFENRSANYGALAEVSYFQKDYVSALKNADLHLKENSDVNDWANLYRELSLKALNKKSDFTEARLTFENTLQNSIANLKLHHLDQRASDLQGMLNILRNSK
jgi:hypothetical protein